ncbi:MAG: IS3 family transposase, partial [Lentisphaeria bacterium]|nr:IS3 family transposase [Lentisphaeria bacterium]
YIEAISKVFCQLKLYSATHLQNIFTLFIISYYYDLETLRQDVADYIDFFNNMRSHQKLGMLTPTEAEEKLAEEK